MGKKYSNFLTILLVVIIIAIVVIIGILGYKYYKTYITKNSSQDFVDTFVDGTTDGESKNDNTNDIQFDLVRLLVGKENNLFVVGDPDQTIYTWRGANLNIIMEFNEMFPSAKTIILDTNYRSSKKILECANKLIKNNKYRLSKDLIAFIQTSFIIFC